MLQYLEILLDPFSVIHYPADSSCRITRSMLCIPVLKNLNESVFAAPIAMHNTDGSASHSTTDVTARSIIVAVVRLHWHVHIDNSFACTCCAIYKM